MLHTARSNALSPIAVLALSAGAAGVLLAVACTGGVGEPSDGVGFFEPVKSSFERAPNSTEAPPSHGTQASGQGPSVASSSGASSGSTGGLSANCAGTYTCVQAGQQPSTAKLDVSGTGCIVEGLGYNIQSDGRVLSNGQQIGTWVGGQNGNVITVNLTAGAGTLVCTKTATGTTSGGTPTPTPTPTATGAPAFDAGK
jgi:hypothetical protein